MNKSNIEYVLDIFKTLTNELPDQMLYRESEDGIELRTLDSSENCSQGNGWMLIGSYMEEVA